MPPKIFIGYLCLSPVTKTVLIAETAISTMVLSCRIVDHRHGSLEQAGAVQSYGERRRLAIADIQSTRRRGERRGGREPDSEHAVRTLRQTGRRARWARGALYLERDAIRNVGDGAGNRTNQGSRPNVGDGYVLSCGEAVPEQNQEVQR